MNLREEIQEEVNKQQQYGDTIYRTNNIVKLCKQWALEMVGENELGFPNSQALDNITHYRNVVRQEIRERINEN